MKNLRDFIDLFNADGYDEKSKLILKISSIIREQGFAQMKIDDFTKYMDISKATFYKHFQSKDEVVECYVRLFIKDFIDFIDIDENISIDIDFYIKLLKKLLLHFIYASQVFLTDIRELYSELWKEMQFSILKRNKLLIKIFENSIEKNIIRKVNPRLLIAQEEIYFSEITRNSFLVSRGITAEEAISDYFILRINQLFVNPDKLLPLSEKTVEQLQFLIQYLSLISI